jgi:hypothetical protein
MGTPLRRKEIRRQSQEALAPAPEAASEVEPNASGHATGLPDQSKITSVGKEA